MADIVANVIAVLQAEGYRTGYANPGRIMSEISGPVVAVNLERVDMAARTVTVQATMVVPLSMGARFCEEYGLHICKVLSNLGGKCELKPCQFNAKSEIFSVAVQVTFLGNVMNNNWTMGDLCQVRFGSGYYLSKVLSFTAWQEPEEGKTLGELVWKIRVEEQLDAIRPEAVPTALTVITVTFEDRQEVYNESKLISRKRVIQDGILVQTWEATAQSRTVVT